MADNNLILSRANAAVIARDFSLAARLYKSLLNEKPNDIKLLNSLGSVYQKSGNDENALSIYKKILAIEPGNTDAAINLGGIYRRLKRYDDSVAVLEQALMSGGDTAKINYNLGFTFKQKGQFSDAINCFEEVLNINPSDVLVFNHIGAIHAERGDHNKAVAASQRGLKIDQNHPVLNLNIAQSYMKLGKLKSAEQAFESALRSKPGMLEAVEGYSSLLIRENRIKEAYEVVSSAVNLNPDNIDMRVKLGNVYQRQSAFDKAEDQNEAALEQNDSYMPALIGLAETQEQQEKYEDAVRTMRRAEEMNPDNDDVVRKSAHVLISADYLPAAYDKISKLTAKNDEDIESLNLMGQYYICTGEEEKREGVFRKISVIDPQYYLHFREGAIRYRKMGDEGKADDFLQKVLAKNPRDVIALNILGSIYENQKRYDEAARVYAKANAIESSNVITKLALERLKNHVEIPETEPENVPVAPLTQEETEDEFDAGGLEINMSDPLPEEQAEAPAEQEAEENEIPEAAESDELDFSKFGMNDLIEDDENIDSMFDDDSQMNFEDIPIDSSEEVQNLDDLVDDDTPVDAGDDDDLIKIPDGSEDDMPFEDEADFPADTPEEETVSPDAFDSEENGFVPEETEAPAEEAPVIPEESVPEPQYTPPPRPVQPYVPQASINPDDLNELRRLTEKAQDALEKANDAAERAQEAAEHAEDIAQSVAAEPEPEENEDFIEDAKLGLDSLEEERPEEEEIKDPQQLLLERAVKMLPSIVRVISDKATLEQFKSTLEMFKKLRELLEYLPEGKKQEFLQSETRLLLDYVISKLSGRPGLYETAKALRDGGLVKCPDEDYVEPREGIELTRKVLDELCLMISYIDDNNLRAVLMQTADSLYEKL